LHNYSAIIYALLGEPGDFTSWIGLSDLQQQGTFLYLDGVPATTANTGWASGEPSSKSENCAMLNYYRQPHNTVNDSVCGNDNYALCEKPLLPC